MLSITKYWLKNSFNNFQLYGIVSWNHLKYYYQIYNLQIMKSIKTVLFIHYCFLFIYSFVVLFFSSKLILLK